MLHMPPFSHGFRYKNHRVRSGFSCSFYPPDRRWRSQQFLVAKWNHDHKQRKKNPTQDDWWQKTKNNQTKNKTIGGKSEKHFIGSESHERCAVNSHGFFSKLQVDVNGMFTPRKNACYGHHDSCVRRGHPRFVLIQFQFSMVNIQVDIIFDGFLGFLSHIMDSPLDTPPELQHGFAYGNQSGWGLDISGWWRTPTYVFWAILYGHQLMWFH